jgi:uncharacterized tellurite resistance protein B-like protein
VLTSIRDFFERHLATEPAESPARHTVELATAALLIEVVRCDSVVSDDERRAVESAVRTRFGLAADEAETLIRLAEDEVRQAHDLYQFTSLVNRHFTQAQKLAVIELAWRAALADAHLSAHEQHVLRRIADLLHVPHGDYIAAKTRARDSAPS